MTELPWLFGNQWLFGLFVALVLLGLTESGYRVGLHLYAAKDQARKSQIAGVQAAVLGLLGLLLGFTFSMAVNRYEVRRDMVLKEANAIGTAWLRASLLPDGHREPAKKLFRQFVDTRVTYQKSGYDPAMVVEGLRLCGEIESSLWQHAEAAAREAPTPITATFIDALNAMIDTNAERIAAHRNRIPEAVWVLLVVVAATGCLITAYGSGAEGVRSMFSSVLLPLLITIVILFINDLLNAHQGFVSISQQPMLDLQASMQAEAGRVK